ncbi:MAG: CoA transferase [Polyangiales bacterium]
MTGALQGVRVLELGQLIAGPFCGQLLGDMGADVIKVEPPGAGDPMRTWGAGPQPLWWEVIARNKRSVSANLRVAEGQALVRSLAQHADILIENFKPGTMEKWGLGPSALQALFPGLIIVRVSGYGQTGPFAERAGFGGIGEAMGGWRNLVGYPDQAPPRMGISIGDTLAASYACMGALAALHARERTGRGQVIDASLFESVLQVMESTVSEFAVTGHVRERSGPFLPGIAPSNVYPCRDGDLLIGANKDELFARLARVMGAPELARDARFVDHAARGRNQRELDELISLWTRQHSVRDVEDKMNQASIPAGRMYRAADMLECLQYQARDAIVEVQTPRWGAVKMQNCFPLLSDTPSRIRTPAPTEVGQDNDAVYGELLGMSPDALRDLRARGVI